MCWFNSNIFWGILLIGLGVSLITKYLFGISLPIVRFLFAGLFIYLGIMLFIGRKPYCKVSNRVLKKGRHEYHTVFGDRYVDLTTLHRTDDKPVKVVVKTIFGKTQVKIDKNVPTEIRVNSICAAARMPDKSLTSFGSYVYRNISEEQEPKIKVEASVFCGELDVVD